MLFSWKNELSYWIIATLFLLSAKISESAEAISKYAVAIPDQVTPLTQELLAKMSQEAEQLKARLQQDIRSVKNQLEPYIEELKSDIQHQVEQWKKEVISSQMLCTWRLWELLYSRRARSWGWVWRRAWASFRPRWNPKQKNWSINWSSTCRSSRRTWPHSPKPAYPEQPGSAAEVGPLCSRPEGPTHCSLGGFWKDQPLNQITFADSVTVTFASKGLTVCHFTFVNLSDVSI